LENLHWLTIVPVDTAIWLQNLSLPWEHRDPADRTIVATAMLRGLPLLSKDRTIAGFFPDTLW
jgi:PIN domain nuclease of toxin-antitoxin system